MLTANEYALVYKNRFQILHKTIFYVECMMPETKHCWIIYKHGSPDKYPVWLYHKHSPKDQCYHLHRKKGSVKAAIEEIKKHDQYQCSGRKMVFNNLY